MAFNSINFIIFLFISLMVYYFISPQRRYIVLFFVSYIFYGMYDMSFVAWILFSTVSTYACALLMNKDVKRKKFYLILAICLNVFILIYFKYTNFIIDNINDITEILNINFRLKEINIVIPLAVSYYTFQVVAYISDVYLAKIVPETNFIKYALFVSFFPKLISGPIEKPAVFLENINNTLKQRFDINNIYRGSLLFIFGIFVKMVVADRLAIIANSGFDKFYLYGSVELVLAVIMYSLQIYCDFNSYSLMALGLAKMFGYSITDNFNVPYFSRSIKEFWRRWHISLSSWLRDYIYIPLGGSRCSTLCKYRNIMITFLISGIWHGASWNFVIWGGLHGIYQIGESLFEPFKKRMEKYVKKDSFSYKLLEMLITFFLVSLAWIFFRTPNISDSFLFIKRMFTKIDMWTLFDGTLFNLGLDSQDWFILLVGLLFILVVDLCRYLKNKSFDALMENQMIGFQVLCIAFMILTTLVFGVYGSGYVESQFIYFQF